MNLFDTAIPKEGEIFTTLLEHKNIKIIRIVSSNSLPPLTYIQEEDEWVVVIQGGALLRIEEEEKILKRGESLFIPSQTKHSVESVEEGTIWLALHIF